MFNRNLAGIIALNAVMLIVFNVSSAQTFLLQSLPIEKTQIGIRYLHPFLNKEFFQCGDIDHSVMSGNYGVTCNIPVTSKINIVGEVPIVVWSHTCINPRGYYVQRDTTLTFDESELGNIYLGMQYRMRRTGVDNLNIALGVFAPTATGEETRIRFDDLGIYTNFYELQKYIPNTLTAYGNVSYFYFEPKGRIMIGAEAGPNILIPTSNGNGTDLFGHYGASFGLIYYAIDVIFEFVGVYHFNPDKASKGNYSNSYVLGAQWKSSRLNAGLFYTWYSLGGDLRYFEDIYDGIIGFKFTVVL